MLGHLAVKMQAQTGSDTTLHIIAAGAVHTVPVAVASRDIIGQAKGILMHRDNLTGLQAFALLTRASQETNVKLIEVARVLVADHERGLAP
jgi:AmiR/NasT family two-component response regulator